ncbi:MAG: superoxide dismutase [Ni] [Planctomycetota bacterium]|jgi:nickel superoxide dismutase
MKRIMNKKLILGVVLLSAIVFGSLAYSHCQVPCGIYGDQTRFVMIAEHLTTIEKSMNQIEDLTNQDEVNANQIVRWVQNKEKHADEISHIITYYFMAQHADEISHIITYYFMAQRVKLPEKGNKKAYNDYIKKLTLLHEMLVFTMKTKQTTDTANVAKLRTLLKQFHEAYSGKAASHEHPH